MTQEMMSRLKPGMTKSQVRFALGTPLVSDVFHPDRWDYVYRFQKAGVLTEQHHVTVVFENDLLKRVEGDVVPASSDKPATAAPAAEEKPAAKVE
ncbi:outer membrane protein assembly factor BamE [Sulfurimicrobium lacus]|uniref:outer membrane protein assembly factor BamE n=1 Tax=Sulfurimicrobium lacus TaxID=2715678 RepID=UPI001FCEF3CE|nr:outer membrane protein assembly factor BamE [Sulfurimicrobium lacus]